jgi:toxin ParE1/3/4
MPRVRKHEAAKRDLVEHFVHLAENASLEVAERFLVNVEESLSDLARHPRLGVVGIPMKVVSDSDLIWSLVPK